MKSIFFPFEQIVNFIHFQIKTHRREVVILMTIVGVLFAAFNFGFLLLFLLCLIVSISYIRKYVRKFINYIRKKDTNEEAINQRGSESIIFLYVICFFVAFIYYFTTKYYNEDLDLTSYWTWMPFRTYDTVNIYSGEPKGNYHKMMESVLSVDSSHFKRGRPESYGGYENATRVMLDPNGLGFVQEDLYKDGDKIKEQINYVTQIYAEKLHILYNKKSTVFQFLKRDISSDLSLGINDSILIASIRNSRIAVGKTGSSTNIIASNVLSEISTDKPTIVAKAIVNAKLDVAFKGIRNGAFDIVFFMSGQPVDDIRTLLRDTASFGLIGLQPSFVDAINRSHGTSYRYADFSIKNGTKQNMTYGPNYENLPTLGSNSYLIANKKVKPYLIKLFIDDLANKKTLFKTDFFNFKETFNKDYQEKKKKTLASLILSFSGGVALGTLILSFIFALVSSFYHDKFYNQFALIITDIPDDKIPTDEERKDKTEEDRKAYLTTLEGLSPEERTNKIELIELYYTDFKKSPLTSPYIKYYQKNIININIIDGMSTLLRLRQDVNKALNDGKLNIEHFNDLLTRMDLIMDKLRKSLFLRLHELLKRSEDFERIDKNDPSVAKLLLKYVTASYLNFDDYKKLMA